MRPFVTYCGTAQDNRPYHVHLDAGVLRLTEAEAQAISAGLVQRRAEVRANCHALPIDGATPFAEEPIF